MWWSTSAKQFTIIVPSFLPLIKLRWNQMVPEMEKVCGEEV
jgi:hypothetical protein